MNSRPMICISDIPEQEYRSLYSRQRHVQITGLMQPESASELSTHIGRISDWGVSVASYKENRQYIAPKTRNSFGAIEERQIVDMAYCHSGKRFAHVYETASLSSSPGQIGTSLQKIDHELRSESFLGLCENVTGHQALRLTSVVLTRYGPGHYYARHTDSTGGGGQKVSFIVNLTRNWRPHWGGLLQFHTLHGHATIGYLPKFNSLNIFESDLEHSVSMVARYVRQPRIALAGVLSSEKQGAANERKRY